MEQATPQEISNRLGNGVVYLAWNPAYVADRRARGGKWFSSDEPEPVPLQVMMVEQECYGWKLDVASDHLRRLGKATSRWVLNSDGSSHSGRNGSEVVFVFWEIPSDPFFVCTYCGAESIEGVRGSRKCLICRSVWGGF